MSAASRSLALIIVLCWALVASIAMPSASAQNRDLERRIVVLPAESHWYNYAPALLWDGDTGTYKLYTCFGEQIPGVGGQDIIGLQEALTLDELVLSPLVRAFAPPTGADSATAWDRNHTCDPNVIKHEGTYYLYYGGLNNDRSLTIKETAFGVATSTDGRSFERLVDTTPIGYQTDDIGWLYGIGQPATVIGPDGLFYLVYTSQATPQWPQLHELVFLRSTEPTFRPETTEELMRIDANRLGVGVSVDFFYDRHRDQFGVVGNLSANLGGQTHVVVAYLNRELAQVDKTTFETWDTRFGEGAGIMRDLSGHTGALPDGREGLVTFAGATFSSAPPRGIPAHISGATEILQFRRDIDLDGVTDIDEGFFDPPDVPRPAPTAPPPPPPPPTVEELLVAYPQALDIVESVNQALLRAQVQRVSPP